MLFRSRLGVGKLSDSVCSGFQVTGARFQSASRDVSPENHPVYTGLQFKSVRFNRSHLYLRNTLIQTMVFLVIKIDSA